MKYKRINYKDRRMKKGRKKNLKKGEGKKKKREKIRMKRNK